MASLPPPERIPPQETVQSANVAAVRLTLPGAEAADGTAAPGTDLSDRINPRLISLGLTESRDEKADKLELTLHNHDGLLAPIRKGVIITLALGWIKGSEVTLGLVDKGRFTVDEVKKGGPPDVVTLTARSADLGGRFRKRRDAIHKSTTLGAVVARIARANGYRSRVHASLASLPIAMAEQRGKSDMAFLHDLGKRYDATATVKDRTVIFAPIGGGQTAAGTTLPTLALTKRHGWTWNFTEAQRDENDGASAQYHDPATARRRTARSGGTTNPRRLRRTYASEADAQAAADAQHQRQGRAQYSFDYELAFGDPAIVPGRPVTLTGWDSQIDAIRWTVKEASHDMGADGLKSRITLDGRG